MLSDATDHSADRFPIAMMAQRRGKKSSRRMRLVIETGLYCSYPDLRAENLGLGAEPNLAGTCRRGGGLEHELASVELRGLSSIMSATSRVRAHPRSATRLVTQRTQLDRLDYCQFTGGSRHGQQSGLQLA